MATTVRMTKDRFRKVAAGLGELTGRDVLVGVPQEDAERMPEPGDLQAPITNAQIGYLMEFGSPRQNIPARPFLIPGVRDAKEQVGNELGNGINSALAGKPEGVERALNRAGIIAMNSVRRKITQGPFVALSPRTLAQRRARGRTGTRPLIDTGQLRRAITYVIRMLSGRGATAPSAPAVPSSGPFISEQAINYSVANARKPMP